MALLGGCSEHDRKEAAIEAKAQAENAAERAKGMAESLWISAQREAERLTPDSGKEALQSARSKLLDLQSQYADVKNPSDLDALKMTHVETEISRLEAALDLNEIKAKMDALKQGDRRLNELKDRYDEAKENYDSAMSSLIEFRRELESHGVPMPK